MKIKILIIVEAANPEWVSVPLVGWSLANAIRLSNTQVHIVTQLRNRDAFLRKGLKENIDFTVIDSEVIAALIWRISNFFRGGSGKGWTTLTAFNVISYYYFEYLVWKNFSKQIKSKEFNVVHRITPLTPTYPSTIAKKCSKAGVKFVIGPLNGGVPWPKWFNSARHEEKEWLSYIRDFYKFLPGYKQTLKYSDAIIAGSKFTLNQLPSNVQSKSFYLPENGIDKSRFTNQCNPFNEVLRICFVGRLVPYKGADMLLEAALPLLKEQKVHIDIIGDGPMMSALKEYVNNHDVSNQVNFKGWVPHEKIQSIMCESQILGFPSIREFGGGVVLEAMALGIVPLVVDYAGPGELVDENVGFKVPIGNRDLIIKEINLILLKILNEPNQLTGLSSACINRVNEFFAWEVKAKQIEKIYEWVLSENNKSKPIVF